MHPIETTADGRYKAVFKPLKTSSGLAFRIGFNRQSIAPLLAAPVHMTLLHNDAVSRSGQISSCRATTTRIKCR